MGARTSAAAKSDGAGLGGCGRCCFAGLLIRREGRGSGTKAPPTFQPRDPPEPGGPRLSLQARIAARNDDAEALDLLVSVLGQSLGGLDEQGRTALFYAVRGTRDDGGNLEPAGRTMANPKTPTFAPGCRRGGAARHLVEKHGLDPNFQIHDTGLSPLMEAARYGSSGAARALLEARADAGLRDVHGNTALAIAQTIPPAYFDFQEAQCSSNRWEDFMRHIAEDRGQVAKMLLEVAGQLS